MRLVRDFLSTVSDGRTTRIFDKDLGYRQGTVAEVEVEVLAENIIVTIRRLDEAKSGPISVVFV